MTIYEAVAKLTNIAFFNFIDASWGQAFIDIFNIVVTCIIILTCIIMPFYLLIRYGLFGNSKKKLF